MAGYVRKEKFYKKSTEYEVTYLLCWSACRIDKPDEYRLYQDLSVCWFSRCDAGPMYVNSQPQWRSNCTSPIKTRWQRQRNQLLYHSVSGFYISWTILPASYLLCWSVGLHCYYNKKQMNLQEKESYKGPFVWPRVLSANQLHLRGINKHTELHVNEKRVSPIVMQPGQTQVSCSIWKEYNCMMRGIGT